ncbi:transcription initiation factor TFIID subunit 12 isoform X1 [Chelonus insularis]|uniref:transcription initiation factor TFIID subunit 12 isoform X1 n=1 Tax=Chelonus insularis TaxID=460826 RepID=UPI00158C6C39|nr:transcription initiation factor TFIID subunit 12 isoform X1 [Chelonus insularis]
MSQNITGIITGNNGSNNNSQLSNLQTVGLTNQSSVDLQSNTVDSEQHQDQQQQSMNNNTQTLGNLQSVGPNSQSSVDLQNDTTELNQQQQLNSTQPLGNLQSVGPKSQSSVDLQTDTIKSEQHQQSNNNTQSLGNLQSVGLHSQSSVDIQNDIIDSDKPQQQKQQSQIQSQTIPSSIHSTSHSKNQSSNNDTLQFLTKSRLQELVKEVDPTEQLDDEVEEMLLQLADDFVETTVNAACLLAKHRHANTVEVKDVQLHLERNWNMWIPGFGTDEVRPYKRATVTEAHKQRLALIRKSVKKY